MLTKVNFSWLYPSYINVMLRPFFIAIYALFSLLLIKAYLLKKKYDFAKIKAESSIKWLILIVGIMFFIGIVYLGIMTNLFYNQLVNGSNIKGFPYGEILYFFMCLIPVLILIFPEILYDVKKIKKPSKPEPIVQKDNHNEMVKTADLILDYLKKEEHLASPNLDVNQLCSALGLSKEEVDYCFAVVLNTKLATIKKQLRVELAMRELKNGKLLDYSMEGIWTKAGFTSKTSFFVSFKEVTGLTPVEYLNSINKA
jgi:AraC-like DNA-binding protein